MKITIFYNTNFFKSFIEEFDLKWVENRIEDKIKEIITCSNKIEVSFFRSKEIKDLKVMSNILNDDKPLKINNQIVNHLFSASHS